MRLLLRSAALVAVLSLPTTAFADPALWGAKCKSCHGEDGKGKTKQGIKEKVEDMTTAKWQADHDDAKVKKAILEGVPDTKMKSFREKLSDAEVDALVKHVRSFKP